LIELQRVLLEILTTIASGHTFGARTRFQLAGVASPALARIDRQKDR